jgi:hypothetical protein
MVRTPCRTIVCLWLPALSLIDKKSSVYIRDGFEMLIMFVRWLALEDPSRFLPCYAPHSWGGTSATIARHMTAVTNI